MKLYRPLLILSLAILVFQLLTIDVTFHVFHSSYGDFAERIKEKVMYFTSAVQSTRYSAMTQTKYSSMVFTGDVMLGRNVEYKMDTEGNSYPFAGLELAPLGERSAIVGNFESSMATPHIATPALQMKFSTNPEYLEGLSTAGFTHLSLANNHSFDYGIDGYKTATTELLKHGIVPFGSGVVLNDTSVTYVTTSHGVVALIGINASASIPSQADMRNVFEKVNKQSDLQIVYIHWGIEYDTIHSKTQKLLAKELVGAGADLIVGHHPHVVQDVDVIDGVVVFYSLGNYIFDQYFSEDVKEGLVLSLDLVSDAGVYLLPVESKNPLSQPQIMSPENHKKFLESLAKRSHPSLKTLIETGYIPLGRAVATSTKMAIMVR